MPADKVAAFADELRYTDLVAGYYVDASEPVLSAISDFSIWFFLWDDRHAQDTAHRRDVAWNSLREDLHHALDAPRRHLSHPDPLVKGFADSVARLFSHLPRRWNARFARHMHAIIETYDEEYHNTIAGRVPTVDEYVELRRQTFGHEVWIDLLELAAGRELPPRVRQSTAYRRAGLASQDFSAWYNDLCSLPKELAGKEQHNLGISLIHHEGLTAADASREVRRRAGGRVAAFLNAETDVLHLLDEIRPNPAITRTAHSCLSNMRNWFSSVYWFHHESARYRLDTWQDPSHPPYVVDPGGQR
ncbi:epi-isozizaene synthase [Nonomuraea solani]|uniref:Terpene synthase n=1 Tax=Nonomuraea solani TaxID=1144553 RepID=A0A1H6EPK7_9ACTN|nr:hypothetical protein [Nonomuraea solani]SEG99762.1 epi-isozizaene synthase [Nonomuraea solani]